MSEHEKRYDDDEVREIFDRAMSREHSGVPATTGDAHGLTLEELQEIAREVGVSPARIAEAASALQRVDRVEPRRSLVGAPVSVGRTVSLARAPTDHEWDVLLTEIRRTFGAQGGVKSFGGHREWRNGRLFVAVEPTADGHQLRMSTTKTNGLILGVGGVVALAASVVFAVGLFLGLGAGEEMFVPLVYALAGVVALAANRLRLPPWAAEREAQMEHLAERAREVLGAGDGEGDGEPAA